MNTVSLTLNEILELAKKTLLANGWYADTASILADTIMRSSRYGSASQGLFILTAHWSVLNRWKVNGN